MKWVQVTNSQLQYDGGYRSKEVYLLQVENPVQVFNSTVARVSREDYAEPYKWRVTIFTDTFDLNGNQFKTLEEAQAWAVSVVSLTK